MQVTLQSTTKIVELRIDGTNVPARIWEGQTANGVRVHAYIIRIAVKDTDDVAEFDRDLKEHAAPSVEVQAIPLRLVL